MFHRVQLLTLFALLPLALSFDIKGSIIFDSIFPNSTSLTPGSRVVLNHGDRSAYIRQDGSFSFPNLGDGVYLLQPHIPGYSVQSVLITIQDDQPHVQTHIPNRQPLPTTSSSLPHPIRLKVMGKEDYFTAPPGFQLFGLLKNPMVLMMLASGVLMYGLPKITAMIDTDPELAKEVAETRKRMGGMQNMDWTGSLSNMLAGSTPDEPVVGSGTGANTPVKGGGGGGGGGNRGGKGRRGR